MGELEAECFLDIVDALDSDPDVLTITTIDGQVSVPGPADGRAVVSHHHVGAAYTVTRFSGADHLVAALDHAERMVAIIEVRSASAADRIATDLAVSLAAILDWRR
jgi:hypothetical protein